MRSFVDMHCMGCVCIIVRACLVGTLNSLVLTTRRITVMQLVTESLGTSVYNAFN